jgi:hypothetical protein
MQNALDEMVIDGIKTNIPLQARIMADETFRFLFAYYPKKIFVALCLKILSPVQHSPIWMR